MAANDNLLRTALDCTSFITDERALLKQKIRVKSQALKIIGEQRRELHERLFLLNFKRFLESQIKNDFDQDLSSRLDAVIFLLEGQNG